MAGGFNINIQNQTGTTSYNSLGGEENAINLQTG
jgi:hypothetical protein